MITKHNKNNTNNVEISFLKEIITTALLKFRKQKEMTQNEMVEYLQSQSSLFHALDAVTLSRWENAITAPSFSRKVELILVMRYPFKKYLKDLIQPPKSITKYNKFTADDYSLTSQELSIIELSYLNVEIFTTLKEELYFIFKYENIDFDFLLLEENIGKLRNIFKLLNLKIYIYKIASRLAGHLVILQPKNYHWDLINNNLNINYIYNEMEVSVLDTNNYNNHIVLGMHSSNEIIFKHLLSKSLVDFIFSSQICGNLSFLAHRKSVVNTLKSVGFHSHINNEVYTITAYDAMHSKSMLEIVSYISQ